MDCEVDEANLTNAMSDQVELTDAALAAMEKNNRLQEQQKQMFLDMVKERENKPQWT